MAHEDGELRLRDLAPLELGQRLLEGRHLAVIGRRVGLPRLRLGELMRRSLEMGSPTPDDAPDRPRSSFAFGAFLRTVAGFPPPDSRPSLHSACHVVHHGLRARKECAAHRRTAVRPHRRCRMRQLARAAPRPGIALTAARPRAGPWVLWRGSRPRRRAGRWVRPLLIALGRGRRHHPCSLSSSRSLVHGPILGAAALQRARARGAP